MCENYQPPVRKMYFIINTVMFNQTYIKNENKMNTDKKLKNKCNPNLPREKKKKEKQLKCMNQQALEEVVDKAEHVILGHMSFF